MRVGISSHPGTTEHGGSKLTAETVEKSRVESQFIFKLIEFYHTMSEKNLRQFHKKYVGGNVFASQAAVNKLHLQGSSGILRSLLLSS